VSGDYNDADFLEQVYDALFARVSTALFPQGTFPGGNGFQTALRVVDVPDNVPPAAQPALYQIQGAMNGSQRAAFGPQRWELDVFEVVYLRADGAVPSKQQVVPDTVANYVVWGVFQALQPTTPGEKQTLGGIAYHAWIEGPVVPEVAEQQVVIVIPIKVLI